MAPFITVIIPCRNEEQWIASILYTLLRGTYPADRLEVFVIDGGSTDDTRAIAQAIAQENPFIQVIDNPKGSAGAAMNIGIALAKGEYIVRMDGHAMYPLDYLQRLIEVAQATGADNVGAMMRTLPGANTTEARAVALITSSTFGVGDSRFRTGVRKPPFSLKRWFTFWKH